MVVGLLLVSRHVEDAGQGRQLDVEGGREIARLDVFARGAGTVLARAVVPGAAKEVAMGEGGNAVGDRASRLRPRPAPLLPRGKSAQTFGRKGTEMQLLTSPLPLAPFGRCLAGIPVTEVVPRCHCRSNRFSQYSRLEGSNVHVSNFGNHARNYRRCLFIEHRGRIGGKWLRRKNGPGRRVWRNPRLRRPIEHGWLFRVWRKTWHGRKRLGWLFRVRRKTWHGRKRLGRPAVDRWRSRFGRIVWDRWNVEGPIGRHERPILGWKCRERRRRGWR